MAISPSLQFNGKQGFSIVVLYHSVSIKNIWTYLSQKGEKFN